MKNLPARGLALSIGDVARRANLAVSAIRYYEAEGLLDPPARVGGKRRYAESVFDRLALIHIAQQAGFRIAEIRALLDGIDRGGGVRALKVLARKKLPEVEEQMRHLRVMKKLLDAAITCGCPDLHSCVKTARRHGLAV